MIPAYSVIPYRLAGPSLPVSPEPGLDLALSSLEVDLDHAGQDSDMLLSSAWIDDLQFDIPEAAADLLGAREVGLAVLREESGLPWQFSLWADEAWGRVYAWSRSGELVIERRAPVMEFGASERPDAAALDVAAACAARHRLAFPVPLR